METLIADAKKDVDLRIVDADEAADEESEDKNKMTVSVNVKG